MDNPELGRKVLDVADFEPEHFDMHVWAKHSLCGTVACLAGHALLQAGYELDSWSQFVRPDDLSYVTGIPWEAELVLGMTGEEVDGAHGSNLPLWNDFENGLERFRAVVEKAEKEQGGR